MRADPPTLREALERDGEVAALREELPLAAGFALYVVLTRAPRIAQSLSGLLAEALDAEVTGGALTGSPEDCARRIAEALLGGSATRGRRVLDLGHAMPRHEAAFKAVLARLNERRGALGRGGPLVLLVPAWFAPLISAAAPDLWSVRSEVFRPAVDLRVSEHDEVLLAALFASGLPPHDYSSYTDDVLARAVERVAAVGPQLARGDWQRIGNILAEKGRWSEALAAWEHLNARAPESDPLTTEGVGNELNLRRMTVARSELGDLDGLSRFWSEGSSRAWLAVGGRFAISVEAWRRTAAMLGGRLSDAILFAALLDADLSESHVTAPHRWLTIPDHFTSSISRAALARNLTEPDTNAIVAALIDKLREDRQSLFHQDRPAAGDSDEDDATRVGWTVVETLIHAEALLVGDADDTFDLPAALATLHDTDIVHPRLDVERACVALHLRAAAAVTRDDALALAVAPLASDAAVALDRLLAQRPEHPWWPRVRDGLRRELSPDDLAPRVVVLPSD